MERLQAAASETPLFAAVSTEGASVWIERRIVRHTGRGTLAFGNWPRANEEK